MTAENQFLVPAPAGFAEGRRKLECLAPHLRALSTDGSSVLSDALFDGLEFPELTKLDLLPSCRLEGAAKIFEKFVHLKQLSFWASTQEQCETAFPLLAAAPFWDHLTHLEILLLLSASDLDLNPIGGWTELWLGRELSIEMMKLSGLEFPAVETLLKAHYPRLRYLSLAAALPEALLPAIASADMPALEILDVRFNMISGEGLKTFAQTAREHLPNLREVGVEMYTGERVDYNDWNGALVGGYDVQYTPEELERLYLDGTGISVMRETPVW
ncbi:MAG TPA: hypothetical protein VN851_00230 [Thermoanaerobaculia bacterium]|nr:hypothetical protein [Thermoanaerobaculia bacterium]